MKEDRDKGREQLLDELSTLRERVADLGRSEAEHKQAEERATKSEQRFRSLVETTSDWVWEVDQDGHYTYASPKIKVSSGTRRRRFLGKPLRPHACLRGKANLAFFRNMVNSRKPFSSLENVNLHKDGREVVLETSGVPVFDERGEIVVYRGIDRDITGRKRIEEVLRERESRYRELADSLPQIVAEMDEKGTFTFVNRNAFLVTGYTREDLGKGLNVLTMVAPEERARLKRNFKRVILGDVQRRENIR